MGCDIHLFVEKQGANGWESIAPPKPKYMTYEEAKAVDDMDTYFGDPGSYWKYADDGKPVPWNVGRNYALFTVLAGVRNDCVENTPISEPLYEMPREVSKDVAEEYAEWGADAHTAHSYTLAELLAHDWDQPFHEQGVIGLEEAIRLKNGEDASFLTSWSGWASGGGIEVLPWTVKSHEREHRFASMFGKTVVTPTLTAKSATVEEIRNWAKGVERPLVQMVWSVPQRQYCASFVDKLIPALQAIGEPDKVRIVFWFDN